MNKYRQQILLAILGLMIAYFVGEWLFQAIIQRPRQLRLDRAARLMEQIKRRELELKKALEAGKQLAVWEAQSLPSDPEIARSYYRAWLLELVKYAQLSNPNVDGGSIKNQHGLYQSIGFHIRASATLEQLTTFLYEFYNAGHLHQIRAINITPLQRRRELDLSISIEALILPGADRKDALSQLQADRLAFSELADYDLIVQRNVFGFGHGLIDPTDYTFLTAVVMVDGRPQAWFTNRATDEVLKLFPGDALAAGQFRGTVQSIDGRDVVLQSDGERWLITVGENLGQALALPPEY